MSYDNVPDDWNSYWERCSNCGRKYHASEGGCDCLDEGDCIGCGETCGRECYDEEGKLFICEDCVMCVDCGSVVKRTTIVDIDGDLFCEECAKK